MPLNANIILAGDLDRYVLSGDDTHAINEVYSRISKQGTDFLGALDSDASLGRETGLRHWTSKSYKRTIFFRAGNTGGNWTLTVYGHGKHYGTGNKKYNLFTWEHGNKQKVYGF